MNILITGACGMVGSHMVEYFHREGGHKIVGTYFKPTTDLEDIRGKVHLVECDVRYYQRVLDIIDDIKHVSYTHLTLPTSDLV